MTILVKDCLNVYLDPVNMCMLFRERRLRSNTDADLRTDAISGLLRDQWRSKYQDDEDLSLKVYRMLSTRTKHYIACSMFEKQASRIRKRIAVSVLTGVAAALFRTPFGRRLNELLTFGTPGVLLLMRKGHMRLDLMQFGSEYMESTEFKHLHLVRALSPSVSRPLQYGTNHSSQ